MKIILDTNFMMIPHQFGVDIFEFMKEYEMLTVSSCVDELKKLGKKRGDDGLAARIALKLIKDNKIKIIRSKGPADKSILDYSIREKCAVGTNDKELIKALKNNGIRIIRLKQKKYLSEE